MVLGGTKPFAERSKPKIGFLLATIAGFGLIVYLGAAIKHAREEARQHTCRGRFSQLHMALRNYHEVYGSFPSAYLADSDGQPMHSWRVLLLPYMDGEHIYKQYRFDEPWNGPHNRHLAQADHNGWWHCPTTAHPDDCPFTDYVVVVGPDTAFPGRDSVRLEDIEDGPANTLLLVEIANSNIHWMEPRDLVADEMSFRLNDTMRPSISSPHLSGPGVVFADRITAYRLAPSITPATLKALTTIAGHEPVSKESLIRQGGAPFQLGE